MAITYIPREQKTPLESFRAGFEPYLQMAIQARLQKKLAQEAFEREKELKQTPTPLPPELADFYKKFLSMGTQTETGPGITIDPNTNLPKIGSVTLKGISRGGFSFQPKTETPIEKIQTAAKTQALKETELNLSKIKRLEPIVNTIEAEWLKTKPQAGIEGRLSGLSRLGIAFSQTDKNLSSYRTFVKGMRAQLARAMGDVGNLSEPEQKAAMDLVPSLTDNLETGQEKISKVREFIKNLEQGNIDAARMILGENKTPQEQETDPLGLR